jgi:hypothetical protein
MSRGYFNPSIKRVNPAKIAYNNSIKNAAKQKPIPERGCKVDYSGKTGDKKHSKQRGD